MYTKLNYPLNQGAAKLERVELSGVIVVNAQYLGETCLSVASRRTHCAVRQHITQDSGMLGSFCLLFVM